MAAGGREGVRIAHLCTLEQTIAAHWSGVLVDVGDGVLDRVCEGVRQGVFVD